MSGANRIKGKGRLTPAKTLRFSFDGKVLLAVEGDTIASALIANGIHLTGRSFKYHRPRGMLSAGPEEPNALIDIGRDAARRTPNIRATVQEVLTGCRPNRRTAGHHWPFDIGGLNNLASRHSLPPVSTTRLSCGRRRPGRRIYEPIIRAAAGLGVAPSEPDPDHYANHYVHCDVLVIGGGAAGLSSALAAAHAGAEVILCDEQAETGGAFHHETDAEVIDGMPGWDWAQAVTDELRAMANVRLLTRTTAFGYQAQNHVALLEGVTEHLAKPDPSLPRERLWQVRAKQVVIATGAIERPHGVLEQ
jgi:sarcosine oxidase subunit alpha